MSRDGLGSLPLELQAALTDVVKTLEKSAGPDRSRNANLLASAVVEFSAFETALNGQSMEAARLIQIASELDRLARPEIAGPQALPDARCKNS